MSIYNKKVFFSLSILLVLIFPLTVLSNNLKASNMNESNILANNANNKDSFIDESEKLTQSTQVKAISWETFQGLENELITSTSSSWEFGPTPSYTLTYENGTPIGLENATQTGVNNKWIVDLKIPLDALAGEGYGLGGFQLSYLTPDYSYMYGGIYGYSNITFDYPPYSFVPGWFSLLMEVNSSDPTPSPPPSEFYIYDDTQRSISFNTTSNSWDLHITGHLDPVIPKGRWQISLFIVDENFNSVSFGYHAYQTSTPPYRDFFIGSVVDTEFGGFEGHKTTITDSYGNILDSVTRNVSFNVNLNISSYNDLVYAMFVLDLPYSYEEKLNVTDYYQNTTTFDSGWVYNNTLGYYQWMTGIEGSITKDIYGTHETLVPIDVPRDKEINGFYGMEKLVLFVYPNRTVDQIVPKIGIQYWNDILQKTEFFFRDITTNLTDNLVVYNDGSYDYNAGTGKTSILSNLTVIGKVSKGIFLYYNVYVFDVFGKDIRALDQDIYDNGENKIGIEARIANTRLYTSSGEITRETLTVQENESFRVVSELKGEYPDTDIQAVSLSLNGWEEFWNETYNQYSFEELIARYDFIKNEINVIAYNSTERTHLVYGEYIDWEEGEYTGYHWNYTGTAPVWEYGPYMVWEEVIKTGWHWTNQFYDRVTGEWVDEWIGYRSPSNLIGDNDSNLLDILSRSVTFLNGKLIFDMNISITGNTPQLYYNFEVNFEKYEFSEDYDGIYGSQESTIWIKDQVPRINVGGEDIHVDLLDYPLYLEYNSQNYLIKEDPYIMINGEVELIQTFQEYDFYNQESREFLVRGSWNPSTDEYERYYTLLNGTKVLIKETTGSVIYTLEFNISLVTGTDLEYLIGTTIDTFNRYADLEGFDGLHYTYLYKLVDGSDLRIVTDQEIQSEYWEAQDKYNQTMYDILSETSFLLDDFSNYMPLYLFDVATGKYELVRNLQVQNQYTDWESETGSHYVIDVDTGERHYIYKNTTWYDSGAGSDCKVINDVWYCYAPRYIINVSGFNYTLYEGLNVEKIFTTTLPDFGTINVSEKYTLPLFVVKDSPQIILLPTETLPAKYSWQLDSTTSNYGVVPTIKSVNISGELVYLNQSGDYWVLRLASDESLLDIVPFDAVKKDKLLQRIEGQDYWNSSVTGFYIQYGKLSFRGENYMNNDIQGSFPAKTRQDILGEYEPYFLYNSTGAYDYVLNHTTLEEIRVNTTGAIILWKVLINETSIIYTSNSYIFQYVWEFLYYEIRAYNDTIFTFESLDDFKYLGEYHYYPLNASYAGDPLAIYDLDGIYVRLGDYNFYSTYIYLANISNQIVELEYSNDWLPVISVPYQGVDRIISYEVEPILKRIIHEGYKFTYRYEPDWNINEHSSVWSIVIGNPKSNMWGYEVWTVNPDNGALDVDGELSTTNDQYFVRRIYQNTNEFDTEYSHMEVNLFWDPDNTLFDNEYNLSSIMGINRLNYSMQWSETFIWYYAENFTIISDNTLANLQTTMLSGDYSAPGYWGVSWMLQNQTWADIVAEAEENGWDWLTSNNQSYTWLDFGFNQTYYTFSDESGSDTWIYNQLISSWSGLWLYKDSNLDGKIDFNNGEISHTFIPNDIESLVFTSPGFAFDNTQDSGNIILSGDDPDFNTTIDFGIQFVNVSGKTYPVITDVFGNWASYWDWHSTGITGNEYNGFKYRPSNVSIDEISFQLHFDVLSFPGENNANATLKIDQTIGNWKTDVVGGRKNFENYSLAISHLVLLSSSSSFLMSDTTGTQVGNNDVVASDSFIFGSATGTKFASALLKGDYLWAKDPSLAASSTSNTMPIGQFQAIYEAEDELSSVGFKIVVEMYFLAIGFPKWDGFRVFQDPVYSVYAAVPGSGTSAYAPTILESPALTNIEVDEGTTVILSWVATDDDPDYYEILDQNNNVIASGPWIQGVPVSVSIDIISGTNTYFIVFYDQQGHSVQSGLITCTGLITTTTSSSSTTSTPTTTPTTTPTSTSETLTVSRTTEKPKDTGIPGFTIGTILIAVISCLSVILLRRKFKNN